MDEPLSDGLSASPEPAPSAAQAASAEPPPPPTPRSPAKVPARRKIRSRRLVVEMLTITAGVLIALALDGFKDWLEDRRLVTTARTAIERELEDNLEEAQIVAATAGQRMEKLRRALQLANDLIESQNSTVQQIDLGFELAEVSSASFETATRNGALALMSYEEARRYAQAYESQEMFVAYQSRKLQELEAAATYMTADPYGALPADIERFRDHVMAMVAMENIEEQLVARLIEGYRNAMGEEQPSGSGS